MEISAGFLDIVTIVMLANMVIYNSPACSSAAVPNVRMANFLWLLSTRFSDKNQIAEEVANHDSQVHDNIIIEHQPVKVPGLSSSITLLGRESVNDKLRRLFLEVISLDPDGVIRMKNYNVPNIEKYTSETPESEILEGITAGDLKENRPGCDFTFSEVHPNVFFGKYPDCLDFSDTNPPTFSILLTCQGLFWFVPNKAKEAAVPRPYRNNAVGERFSLAPFYDNIGDFSSMKDPCTCS